MCGSHDGRALACGNEAGELIILGQFLLAIILPSHKEQNTSIYGIDLCKNLLDF